MLRHRLQPHHAPTIPPNPSPSRLRQRRHYHPTASSQCVHAARSPRAGLGLPALKNSVLGVVMPLSLGPGGRSGALPAAALRDQAHSQRQRVDRGDLVVRTRRPVRAVAPRMPPPRPVRGEAATRQPRHSNASAPRAGQRRPTPHAPTRRHPPLVGTPPPRRQAARRPSPQYPQNRVFRHRKRRGGVSVPGS
jgi:hypothetical protein